MFLLLLACASPDVSADNHIDLQQLIAQGIDVVPEQYLVAFRSEEAADTILANYPDAKILHRLRQQPVVLLHLPQKRMEQLRENPDVLTIEEDHIVWVVGAQSKSICGDTVQQIPDGIARIGVPVSTGLGIKVGVVDTGVDSTHEDIVVSGSWNFSTSSTTEDVYGHGTHVAGTIAAKDNTLGVVGVAPDAEIYSFKVLDDYGSGTWGSVAAGVDAAISEGMDVINLSLGGRSNSAILRASITQAWAAGVTTVVAAGNEGRSVHGFAPAMYDGNVITVTAWSVATSRFAGWSNFGPTVDMAAPGVDVCSTLPGDNYGVYSGTSMASPHVAGAAALYLESHPQESPDQVLAGLLSGVEALTANSHHNEGLVRVDGF